MFYFKFQYILIVPRSVILNSIIKQLHQKGYFRSNYKESQKLYFKFYFVLITLANVT